MKDAELQREIERAARNTRKLRALQAENERATAEVATVRGAVAPTRAHTSPVTPNRPHPTYAVRG